MITIDLSTVRSVRTIAIDERLLKTLDVAGVWRRIYLLTALSREKSIDFLFVVVKDDRIYTRNGFHKISNYCSWLRIHEHKNYGVAVEKIQDEFMIKQIGDKQWVNEPIDLLGYMF